MLPSNATMISNRVIGLIKNCSRIFNVWLSKLVTIVLIFHLNPYLDFLKFIISCISSERPASRHFSLHRRLSSAKIRQYRQVCAARSKSRGCKKDKTYKASSFGNNEIKSLWNCGSITDIICRTWVGWHLPMSWSIATGVNKKLI